MSNELSLANHFLVAMPGLADPSFARSVTYLCQYNHEGAMGIVINRPSEYRLRDVLAHMNMSTAIDSVGDMPVLLGGPVQPERGFVMHEPGFDWDSSYTVSDEVCVTTSRDVLEAIAVGEGPRRVLVALGYAGWSAGQLESELRENAWLSVPAKADIFFVRPIEQRWEAAVALMGIQHSALTEYAGRA